ncbi:MAG: hypothetical protein Fur0020_04440 [Thermodesulfovibrionia bacterium]
MIKVAIVGAGRGGSSLLEVFHTNGEVRVVGITDRDRNAHGLNLARQWNIFIADNIDNLFKQNPDVIINTTGNPEVGELIKRTAPYHVEVIEGTSARFLWELVKRQQEARRDLSALYQNGILITKASSLQQVMDEVLRSATRITDAPAGSIAFKEGDEMVMIAHRGLSPDFFKERRWRPRREGLTSIILSQKEPVEFEDTEREPVFKGTNILREGIRSLLASPLFLDSGVVGILYLNDFKPRKWTDRHRDLIRLFSAFAAQAIEKFKLLHHLDESLSYLQAILNDSHDMIVTTDKEGRIVKFSKGGERILGYTEEEARGRRASEFYADPNERAKLLSIIREKGAVINHETRLIRKDGSPVDISLTISRLRDREGNVIGTVGVSKDITEEKRLREELKAKNKELEELAEMLEEKVMERTRELEKINKELKRANEVKARLIANMSHELKTPLHSIIGFSEVLLDKTAGAINETQKRYITNILNSGRHLLQLVNNVLDLARIEAGRLQLSCESFPAEGAINEVMMVLKAFAEKKMLNLTADIDESIELFADKVKFKQMLYNLISNAIKFTPDGGSVGIRVKRIVADESMPWSPRGKEFIKVSVWDTGIGIKDEDRDRVFGEFEQLDPSRSTEGVGLGLAMTKRLVELHGGSIDFESIPGKGSTFNIYLPHVRRDVVREVFIEPESYPSLPIPEEGAPLVLVVEDDLPTSELLTLHLTSAGYRVAHAYDGVEAIEKARELQPFVISLDIMLPKKDGWEVLQTLKSDPETKDIPVIINSVIDNKELGFALGAADYLVKPVDKETLLGKLKDVSLLSKKRRYPVRVLLSSNDVDTYEHARSFLEAEGFLVHLASDTEDSINLAMAIKPNVALIDLDMPDGGFNLINKLKDNPATKNIPVFAMTSGVITAQETLAMAGQIERVLRKDALSSREFVNYIRELELLYPQRAGLIDEVTGVFTNRYLHLRLTQEIHRSMRYKIPLILALLDIDHFGDYVQKNGYYYGNLVLKKTAELIRKNVRGSDVIARYGGDAFIIILTNTLLPSGVSLCRRLLSIIHDYPFLYEERHINGRITASMGIVEFREGSPDELIRSAEKALSLAIERGRNRIEVVTPISENP